MATRIIAGRPASFDLGGCERRTVEFISCKRREPVAWPDETAKLAGDIDVAGTLFIVMLDVVLFCVDANLAAQVFGL